MATDFRFNYWKEALECSLSEAGVTLPDDKVELIAQDMETAHDMYGEATGQSCIPNPLQTEISRLQQQMKDKEKAADEKYERMRDYARTQVAARNGTDKESVIVWDHYGRVQAEGRR